MTKNKKNKKYRNDKILKNKTDEEDKKTAN